MRNVCTYLHRCDRVHTLKEKGQTCLVPLISGTNTDRDSDSDSDSDNDGDGDSDDESE